MNEMIERVAMAIQRPLGVSTADAVFAAKRAIEAMREPTDEMKDHGQKDGEGFGRYDGYLADGAALSIWRAMIDAALQETATPSPTRK